jgi:hypothetical protein
MQTETVAKELVFKMRIDEADKARLDALGKQYAAPAATVVRILIKEKFDELAARKAALGSGEDDFRWSKTHDDILDVVNSERDPIDGGDIGVAMCNPPYFYSTPLRGLSLALNQLRRNGYLRRLKVGYVITEKGRAAIK